MTVAPSVFDTRQSGRYLAANQGHILPGAQQRHTNAAHSRKYDPFLSILPIVMRIGPSVNICGGPAS
jgi:hypothetical protein